MTIDNITLGVAALIIADIEGSILPEQKAHLEFLEKELPAVKSLSDRLRSKWNKDNLRELAIRIMKERYVARMNRRRRNERRILTAVIVISGLLAYTIFRICIE